MLERWIVKPKLLSLFNPRIKLCSVSRAFPACLCRYSLKFRRSSRQRENGRHLKNWQYLNNKNTLGTLRRFFNQKFRWGRTDDDVTNAITALCHTPISGPTEITRKQPHCKLISLGRVSMKKKKKPNRRFKAKWLILIFDSVDWWTDERKQKVKIKRDDVCDPTASSAGLRLATLLLLRWLYTLWLC